LIETVELAYRLHERMWGLLGRRGLPAGHAMHLMPCAGIHTLCMLFPLDVVFLDPEMRVVRIVRGVAPFRTVVGGEGAHSALEMATGWLQEEALQVGDAVQLVAYA